jgi:hypothetical protein
MPHWNPLLEGGRVDLHPRVIFLQPLGAIGWLLHRSLSPAVGQADAARVSAPFCAGANKPV